MPPALTLPLTCNAASRKPRADCGSHGAPLRTCVLHLNRPYEDRCACAELCRDVPSGASQFDDWPRLRDATEMRRDAPRCAEICRDVSRKR
eukprot:scaffold63559_cov75-Phaeocystis_antarctica.AAC.3